MIVVAYERGVVAWWRGGSPLLFAVDGDEQARLERLFEVPARDLRCFTASGVIERRLVTLRPGTARHARAVLHALPGAALLVDNEPE